MEQRIEQYIRDMRFSRRKFGGVDEEDVLEHIQTICEMFQEELELSRNGDRDKKNARPEEEAEQEEVARLKEEYTKKNKELTEAIDTIQSMKKDAAVKAQVEATQEAARFRSEIMEKIEEERKQAEGQLEFVRKQTEALRQEKEALGKKIREECKKWMESVDRLIASLTELKEAEGELVKGAASELSGDEDGIRNKRNAG